MQHLRIGNQVTDFARGSKDEGAFLNLIIAYFSRIIAIELNQYRPWIAVAISATLHHPEEHTSNIEEQNPNTESTWFEGDISIPPHVPLQLNQLQSVSLPTEWLQVQ